MTTESNNNGAITLRRVTTESNNNGAITLRRMNVSEFVGHATIYVLGCFLLHAA